MSYNGWSNYETWAVKLWLDNEYGSYSYVTGRAKDLYALVIDDDDMPNAIGTLADELKDQHEEANPLEDAEASVFTDLLRAALSEVDWREIAEAYLNDAKEESE